MEFSPILAADLIQTIFGVVVFILWAIGQYVGSREEAKRKKEVGRPREQEPIDLAEVAERPVPQRPRNQEDALRSEVEDFLRRAQGKPEEPKPTPVVRQTTPERRRPPRREKPQPTSSIPPSIRNEGVGEHVARHLSTDDIAAHTQTLGAKVATADDRLESHLHEKFDHSLGKLGHVEQVKTVDAEQRNDIAAEVAKMLRSPEGVRQIIIANEILRRPEW